MSCKCPLPTNREVEEYQRANLTNTPSPDEDRELIERLRQMHTSLDGYGALTRPINPDGPKAADRLESLLSDRAKLELQVQELLTRCP